MRRRRHGNAVDALRRARKRPAASAAPARSRPAPAAPGPGAREPLGGLKPGPANFAPLTPMRSCRVGGDHPERIAVVHGNAALHLCAVLRARPPARLGARQARRRRGDVVSAMLPNVPAMLEAHYGVPMLGAVLNTINTRLDADTVAYILEHGEAKVAHHRPRVRRRRSGRRSAKLKRKPLVIDVTIRSTPVPATGSARSSTRSSSPRAIADFAWSLPRSDETQPIALNYTSGTTGRPKGVVYHHRGTFLESLGNIVAWPMPAAPGLPVDAAALSLQRLVLSRGR